MALLFTASSALEKASFGASVLQRQLAVDTAESLILSDLLAETRAGSIPGASSAGILYPATPLSAVPWRAPNLPPNLLRQSSATTPSYDLSQRSAGVLTYPGSAQSPPALRAHSVSTATPSSNGISVAPARWNAPALLPRSFPSDPENNTPAFSGTAHVDGQDVVWNWSPPDWIALQRDGATPSVWSNSMRLNASKPLSSSEVICRYAYQVYDIGGLLDLNFAGFDPDSVSPSEAARKGNIGLADLRQIGLNKHFLQQLVHWRTPGINLHVDGPPYNNAYLNILFAPGMSGGVLRPLVPTTTPEAVALGGRRTFFSRGELIRFVRRIAITPEERVAFTDALQCVTHFSRAIEQPSHRPGVWDATARRWRLPRIVPPANRVEDRLYPISIAGALPSKDFRAVSNLPYEMALGNYRGGNDAWGTFGERKSTGDGLLQDVINPGFLDVRVGPSFLRRDGTTAATGDALVKSRFPLSRLAWLTWKGPSALLALNDPLYRVEGTPEAIMQCFGLEWTRDAGRVFQNTDAPDLPADQVGYGFWKYDHSRPGRRVAAESIGRLQDVAADGREPDFFELLKAGILAGSLGKAAAKNHVGLEGWAHDPASFYQLRDKDLTNQLLEIGANIIDQFDADSFPTIIKIGTINNAAPGGPAFTPTFTARGVENLPYFYRLHWRALENPSDPASPKTDVIREITAKIVDFTGDSFKCGTTSLIAFPELWNPHAPPTVPRTGTLKLRVLAVGEDPEGTASDSGVRPAFPLLGTRWKNLLLTGPADDRHAHFAAWPSGAFAFSLPIRGKSTKTFFHDRRFSTSYEFFGTTNEANDYHSGRLATNAPAEPSSYLFWTNVPVGAVNNRYAIEGFAFWQLALGGFAPESAPLNAEPPEAFRGFSFSATSREAGLAGSPVWFVPTDGRVIGHRTLPAETKSHSSDPTYPLIELRNSEITLDLPLAQPNLFREPTALCRKGLPSGTSLACGRDNFFNEPLYSAALNGADGTQWIGFSLGEVPSQFIAAQRLVGTPSTTIKGTPLPVDSTGAPSPSGSLWRFFQVPVNLVGQRTWNMLTIRLQYQDPLSKKWITYDERFLSMDGRMEPDAPPYQGQWNATPVEGTGSGLDWAYPVLAACDPRTPRFGAFERYSYNWQNAIVPNPDGTPRKALLVLPSPVGAGVTDRPSAPGSLGAMAALGAGPGQFNLSWGHFKAAMDQEPAAVAALYTTNPAWWAVRSVVQSPSFNANDVGWISRLGNPSSPWVNGIPGSRGFSHFWEDYSHDAGSQESTETGKWQYWADTFRQGWLSENRAPDALTPERQAYADADDVVRRASGAYAANDGYSTSLDGLPLAQIPAKSSRSRPVLLDRPFRSVAELAYAFRGAPWKHIDFFTPETGDAALLDIFCVNESPQGVGNLAAGRVNLNTRQEPVLRALLAGALLDEATGQLASDPSVANLSFAGARALLDRTSGTGLGRGPLLNIAELAGKPLGINLPIPEVTSIPNAFTTISTPPTSSSAALYTSITPSTVTALGRNPDAAPGAPLAWTFTGFRCVLVFNPMNIYIPMFTAIPYKF